MTLLLHELKRNKLSLIIWSAAVAFMLGVCVLIYPEMAEQMKEMSDMFANMGALSDAFGLDQLGFKDFMGCVWYRREVTFSPQWLAAIAAGEGGGAKSPMAAAISCSSLGRAFGKRLMPTPRTA